MSSNAIYLGFDFGLRRIGIAVGQDITLTATPLAIIEARSQELVWQEIKKLLAKWNPTALVVGVPFKMDHGEKKITILAQEFVAELREFAKLPVYEVDERLTTKSAREEIFNTGGYKSLQKEPIDSFAASLILESWMHDNLPV